MTDGARCPPAAPDPARSPAVSLNACRAPWNLCGWTRWKPSGPNSNGSSARAPLRATAPSSRSSAGAWRASARSSTSRTRPSVRAPTPKLPTTSSRRAMATMRRRPPRCSKPPSSAPPNSTSAWRSCCCPPIRTTSAMSSWRSRAPRAARKRTSGPGTSSRCTGHTSRPKGDGRWNCSAARTATWAGSPMSPSRCAVPVCGAG